jgi:hypothetical protein
MGPLQLPRINSDDSTLYHLSGMQVTSHYNPMPISNFNSDRDWNLILVVPVYALGYFQT